jgi:tRNA (cmo5U34)-methyltransferase
MPDPAPTASEYFGQMADSYDSLIRRAVPRYDEMIERLMAHLPARASRILELGCGTGNLTLKLLAKYPVAHVTTVDAAPEMTALTAARARERGLDGNRLETVTARFEQLSQPAGSFDVVASCMSLHHVKDKAPLYLRIHGWLARGGSLWFADQLLGATPEIQTEFWRGWLAFCREPGHCSEEEISSLEAHAAAHDHYEPLTSHLRLLEEAGFARMDCVWRNFMYSVVGARRDEPRLG